MPDANDYITCLAGAADRVCSRVCSGQALVHAFLPTPPVFTPAILQGWTSIWGKLRRAGGAVDRCKVLGALPWQPAVECSEMHRDSPGDSHLTYCAADVSNTLQQREQRLPSTEQQIFVWGAFYSDFVGREIGVPPRPPKKKKRKKKKKKTDSFEPGLRRRLP